MRQRTKNNYWKVYYNTDYVTFGKVDIDCETFDITVNNG